MMFEQAKKALSVIGREDAWILEGYQSPFLGEGTTYAVVVPFASGHDESTALEAARTIIPDAAARLGELRDRWAVVIF
jgi:hypothetical protein